MSPYEILIRAWGGEEVVVAERDVLAPLEAGRVLFLPALRFAIEPVEAPLFTPSILASAKNASFDPRSARLGGTSLDGDRAEHLVEDDLQARRCGRRKRPAVPVVAQQRLHALAGLSTDAVAAVEHLRHGRG